MVDFRIISWLIPIIILSRCYLSSSKTQVVRYSVYSIISSLGAISLNHGGGTSLAIIILLILLVGIITCQRINTAITCLDNE
tara:strand:+ start:36027 stop:36272 length:246 start_codon:yes stop_codon:yes gene_type:complete